MSEDQELQRLRRALTAAGGDTTADCPHPDRIWAAAHGELPHRELAALAHHAAVCPLCLPAWRLARELAAAQAQPATEVAAKAPRTPDAAGEAASPWAWGWRLWAPGLAAAAFLIAMLVLVPFGRQGPTQRGGDHAIGSRVETESLPRDAFTLRWTPVADTRYTIEVSAGLSLLDQATDLERPEHTVKPERLEDLPAGTAVRWQVRAAGEGGRSRSSPVFVTRIE